jgi:signal transduction histidine kinase/DNA-binding NarL/FixJ family response regulator
MSQVIRFIVYSFSCLLSLSCTLAIGGTLAEDTNQLFLGGELRYIEDVRSSLSLEEAQAAIYNEGLNWDAPGFPVFGYTNSTYWASVSLSNHFVENQNWLMKMDFALIDEIAFYYQDREGNWVEKRAGDTILFAGRDQPHHSILFRFPVYAQEIQTFYFRVHSTGSVQLPISAISPDELRRQTGVEYLWIGVFFGVLAILALYSLAIWAATLDKSYLFFSLFIFFGGLYLFSAQGLSYHFLWPDNIYWANRSIPTTIMFACASGLMFISRFLNLRALNLNLNRLLTILTVLTLIYAVVGLVLPLHWINRGLVPIITCVLIAITWVSFDALRRRNRQAFFVAASWIVLLISVLIEMTQRLGVNFPPLLSFHSIQLGAAISSTILALGIGDRINALLKNYGNVQSEVLTANQLKIEALQRADDVKEEFIANVSHELKTPLTGIIGLSEIILDSKRHELDEGTIESLNMIKISGQRLSNLVNDVIDFSSIKQGELELDRRAVDLKRVCTLVNKMCRPLIGDKPIQLAEHFPDDPVVVLGDEDRLQQILFNLVSNAIKFTPRGWVAISIERIDIDVRISVKDTGVGISREQQAKIFNRFYQIDSGATRERGGTGLGLAISQKLVELHGTEIVLRSSLGEGSTFYFDLPLYGGQLISSEPENKDNKKAYTKELISTPQLTGLNLSPAVERRTNAVELEAEPGFGLLPSRVRRRILVVDDEYLNVKIVKEHLSATYDMVSALGGNEALEIIEKNKPDLILLDLMMPIMTGFELCRIVRQQYNLDELPIVILTAKNRVEDLVKGLSMGANDYISKPFSKEELKVRVGKQIELLDLTEIRKENQLLSWQLKRYQASEKKLREREARLASMLDVTGDALVSINEEGLVVYVNKPAEEMLNISSDDYNGKPLAKFITYFETRCPGVAETVRFPFNESVISQTESPTYFEFSLLDSDSPSNIDLSSVLRVSVLALNLEQDFFLLMIEKDSEIKEVSSAAIEKASLPELITQINKNVERTQVLTEYLAKITPEDLNQHRHLFADLEDIDKIINKLVGTLPKEEDSEQVYREALVKLMQDCHYYWQKVTGESIIDLAEKSRIWSVSIDNGRLRTRSMNRYLSVDKIPKNPRWRQVARTAYFVLSKVSSDAEAKEALEKSVGALQEIVESRALN